MATSFTTSGKGTFQANSLDANAERRNQAFYERQRMEQQRQESEMQDAALRRKAEKDRQYEQGQNEFAQRFGRGLTSGAASSRGQAGQRVNVPPGAMHQPPRAMGRTYWDQGDATSGQGNPIEAQGELARAGQSWLDAGDDTKKKEAAKQALIKSYNDSPFSSVTDATDIEFDKAGNMKFKVGDKYINNKSVSVDDFRRIGESNNLMDQSVYQRDAGSGAMQGRGLQPAQSKSAVKAAEMMGGADIKMMGDQVKQLEKQLDITSDADKPALIDQIKQAKQMQREAINQAGKSVYGAGLQGQAQQPVNPAQDMQQLVDSNKSDSEIKQIMWSKYGSDDVMNAVNVELRNRGQEPGGLSVPDPQAGMQEDIPVGPGQPDLKLGTAPAVKKQPEPTTGFKQKYESDTKLRQEKEATKKAELDTFKKVRRLYDIMGTTKRLKPADVDYLQSVYDDPNASAKVKKEAYSTYKKYRDLNP